MYDNVSLHWLLFQIDLKPPVGHLRLLSVAENDKSAAGELLKRCDKKQVCCFQAWCNTQTQNDPVLGENRAACIIRHQSGHTR